MNEITFDLTPLERPVERAAETAFYETLLGKRNRISIGHPVSRRVAEKSEGVLLETEDLERFTAEAHVFWQIELALTLLPDRGCRFSSCDLWLEFDQLDNGMPLFWRLRPDRVSHLRTVRRGNETKASAGFGQLVQDVVDLTGAIQVSRQEEWQATIVALESFGARSPSAGWRMTVTDAGEIPLCSEGLKLLCVLPIESSAKARISVRAEIDILGPLDRWATAALRGVAQAGLEARIAVGA
jgi:hypothetical protein